MTFWKIIEAKLTQFAGFCFTYHEFHKQLNSSDPAESDKESVATLNLSQICLFNSWLSLVN